MKIDFEKVKKEITDRLHDAPIYFRTGQPLTALKIVLFLDKIIPAKVLLFVGDVCEEVEHRVEGAINAIRGKKPNHTPGFTNK